MNKSAILRQKTLAGDNFRMLSPVPESLLE